MKFRLGSGLFRLNLLVLLLLLATFSGPLGFASAYLSLPFLLFFQGYVLLLALLPCAEDLKGIERFGLSLSMSLAVSALRRHRPQLSPLGHHPGVNHLPSSGLHHCAVGFCQREKVPPGG